MWKDSQRAARARFPGADGKAREVPVVETRAAEQGGAGVNGKPTGKKREPGLSPRPTGRWGGNGSGGRRDRVARALGAPIVLCAAVLTSLSGAPGAAQTQAPSGVDGEPATGGVIGCPLLEPIVNSPGIAYFAGETQIPEGLLPGLFLVPGFTATYQCLSGARLDGNPDRRCGADGQWSGRPPDCVAVPTLRIFGHTPSPEEGDTLRVTLERYYEDSRLRVRNSALVVPLSVHETGSMLAPSRGGSFAFFFPGRSTASVLIKTIDDSSDEPDSVFTVEPALSRNYVVDRIAETVEVTVRDNDVSDPFVDEDDRDVEDMSPPSFSVSVSDRDLIEGESATLTITLDAARETETSIGTRVSIRDRTTLDGVLDYHLTPDRIVIPAGSTFATLEFTAVVDALDEPAEVFELRLGTAVYEEITIQDAPASLRASVSRDRSAMVTSIEFDDDRDGHRSLRDRVTGGWLPRFGAMVTGLVTETIEERLVRGGRRGTGLVVGGHDMSPVVVDNDALAGSSFLGADGGGASTGMKGAFEDSGHGVGGHLASPVGRVVGSRDRPGLSAGELVSRSAFTFQRRAGATPAADWAIWGKGSGAGFDEAVDDLSLDGRGVSGGAGLEHASEDWMGGFALFHSQGEGSHDLSRARVSVGEDIAARLTSVHPYLHWSPDKETMLWGMAGYGWGKMTVSDSMGDHVSDISLSMGALGGHRRLYSRAGMDLSLVSKGFWGHVRSEETADWSRVTGDVHRVWLGLEAVPEHRVAGRAGLRPSAKIGLRHDGGDVREGLGLEIGGALGYAVPSRGLTVEMGGRVLAAHSNDRYHEWGVSGLVHLAPDARGRGLQLALEPSFGATAERLDWRLEQDVASALSEPAPAEGRLDLRLGYGFPALRRGFLTPHGRMLLSSDRAPLYGAGLDLDVGSDFTLGLESTHRFDDDEHGFRLRADFTW